jgi:hypothetical protein
MAIYGLGAETGMALLANKSMVLNISGNQQKYKLSKI